MGGGELLFMLVGWVLPLAVAVFLVTSIVRVTRSLAAIQEELGRIRQVLERDRQTS